MPGRVAEPISDQVKVELFHSRGIIEALRKVYEANDRADELTDKK